MSSYADAFNQRGVAEYNKGNYEQAIEHFSKALDLSPNHLDALNNRAQAYEQLGETENAKADWDQIKDLSDKPEDKPIIRPKRKPIRGGEYEEVTILSHPAVKFGGAALVIFFLIVLLMPSGGGEVVDEGMNAEIVDQKRIEDVEKFTHSELVWQTPDRKVEENSPPLSYEERIRLEKFEVIWNEYNLAPTPKEQEAILKREGYTQESFDKEANELGLGEAL